MTPRYANPTNYIVKKEPRDSEIFSGIKNNFKTLGSEVSHYNTTTYDFTYPKYTPATKEVSSYNTSKYSIPANNYPIGSTSSIYSTNTLPVGLPQYYSQMSHYYPGFNYKKPLNQSVSFPQKLVTPPPVKTSFYYPRQKNVRVIYKTVYVQPPESQYSHYSVKTNPVTSLLQPQYKPKLYRTKL